MADRRQTPDVLAELLGGDAKVEAGTRPASKSGQVEIVSFQDAHGWRPRFVNGKELPGWLQGPLVHDYINQRVASGWRFVAATSIGHFYGTSDGLQLYFEG